MSVALAVVTMAVLGLQPAFAQFDPARMFVQSAAVRARYPDPPVTYATPGFRDGRKDFTSHEEMLEIGRAHV